MHSSIVCTAPCRGSAGKNVIFLALQVAFCRRTMFGMGERLSFPGTFAPTFNVHIKTRTQGGATSHGYPDPNYFKNCLAELEGNHITVLDLPVAWQGWFSRTPVGKPLWEEAEKKFRPKNVDPPFLGAGGNNPFGGGSAASSSSNPFGAPPSGGAAASSSSNPSATPAVGVVKPPAMKKKSKRSAAVAAGGPAAVPGGAAGGPGGTPGTSPNSRVGSPSPSGGLAARPKKKKPTADELTKAREVKDFTGLDENDAVLLLADNGGDVSTSVNAYFADPTIILTLQQCAKLGGGSS